MIKSEAISKKYGKKNVFSNVTADFMCKTYGLLGPNGAGKTTFLRILTGLLKATEGEVSYVDAERNKVSMDDCRIGYLPQKFGVFKELTVQEQMEYFAALKKIPSKRKNEEIEKALGSVNLDQEITQKCGKLSGGMVRRLGIAQAILGQPELLLLDEPTAGLDPEERMRFKNIMMTLRHQFPIILSTHIVEDIEAVCEEILVLGRGRILFQGETQELQQKAEGYVYGIKEVNLSRIECPHYAEKYLESTDGKQLRILLFEQPSSAELAYLREMQATIEDGYMYLLKCGDAHEV